MTPVSLIDLDTDGGRQRSGRMRPGWRDRGPWLSGLLVAAVLALVAGDQPMAPLTPSVALHVDGVSDIRGDGQAIYVMTRSTLASYRMPDGARRWAVPVPAGAQLVALDSGRVVLAVKNEENASAATLAGFDAATGAQVWRQTGYVPLYYGAASALGVVVADTYPPGTDAASQQATPSLNAIDIRTGRVRWSLVTLPGATRKLERVASSDATTGLEIAELDPDGALQLRSAETAQIMRTVVLENPGQADGFDISGDRVLVYRTGEGTMLSSAMFDLATGRRLWQRTDDPPGGPFLSWCGRMLCTHTATGGEIAVLDPDTGQQRWSLNGWTNLGPLDDHHMLATRSGPDDEPLPGVLVLDAASGRVLRRIEGWAQIGLLPPHDLLAASMNTAGSLVIAKLDPGTGVVQVLGRAEHWSAPPRCITTATLLICWLDQITIWLVPS